jgi:transcriptional regulator with XRE-family HTH domain
MATIYLKRTSPLMIQLGANISHELKKLGITQGELSERSGVAASHISYMVRGRGNPTLATLESLGDIFGLSVVELLSADNPSNDAP